MKDTVLCKGAPCLMMIAVVIVLMTFQGRGQRRSMSLLSLRPTASIHIEAAGRWNSMITPVANNRPYSPPPPPPLSGGLPLRVGVRRRRGRCLYLEDTTDEKGRSSIISTKVVFGVGAVSGRNALCTAAHAPNLLDHEPGNRRDDARGFLFRFPAAASLDRLRKFHRRHRQRRPKSSRSSSTILSVFEETNDEQQGLFATAKSRFMANPLSYMIIPVIAGLVGYITNWLAVQMIFYPIEWRGLPLRVWENQPFGIFGWQGIVPAKAGMMSTRMVDMVTSNLICVPEVFGRLSPGKVSECLMPMVQDVMCVPKGLRWLSFPFLSHCLRQSTMDLVVGEMLRDRTILVDLFQKVGHQELRFLTDSGLFFGFLLGIIQMVIWLLFPRQWTLPVGGAVVGYLTNWIALKMIFEPVNPVSVFGLFKLQGMFLRRQAEVSVAFSEHLSSTVLTSQKMWGDMLKGAGSDNFFDLLRRNVPWFLPTSIVGSIFERLRSVLPDSPGHVLHLYADKALELETTLIEKMRMMTPAEFEGVLHPIFQEDEFTLILAGAVLGGIAGAVQQRLGAMLANKSTGKDAANGHAKAETSATYARNIAAEEIMNNTMTNQSSGTGWSTPSSSTVDNNKILSEKEEREEEESTVIAQQTIIIPQQQLSDSTSTTAFLLESEAIPLQDTTTTTTTTTTTKATPPPSLAEIDSTRSKIIDNGDGNDDEDIQRSSSNSSLYS